MTSGSPSTCSRMTGDVPLGCRAQDQAEVVRMTIGRCFGASADWSVIEQAIPHFAEHEKVARCSQRRRFNRADRRRRSSPDLDTERDDAPPQGSVVRIAKISGIAAVIGGMRRPQQRRAAGEPQKSPRHRLLRVGTQFKPAVVPRNARSRVIGKRDVLRQLAPRKKSEHGAAIRRTQPFRRWRRNFRAKPSAS